VNEDRFRVHLLGIRGLSQKLLAEVDLTDDQRCSLGAEFHDLAEQILDYFRQTGKFYRRRQDG
jgi:hypothetical protein